MDHQIREELSRIYDLEFSVPCLETITQYNNLDSQPSYILGTIELDKELLQPELDKISRFPKIQEQYDEFTTGDWRNFTLFNADGDPLDTMYRSSDASVQPTAYALQIPYISALLKRYFHFDLIRMVRIRTLKDATVIIHRDFVELLQDRQYFRVLIPLEDNLDAYHSDESGVFQMRAGEVWYLNAASAHSAANFSPRSRILLGLDFQFVGGFTPKDIFHDFATYAPRPAALVHRKSRPADLSQTLAAMSTILTRESFKDVAFLLAKLHFTFNVPITSAYDWLVEIALRTGDSWLVDKSEKLRRYMIEKRDLSERFSFHEESCDKTYT